MKKTPCLVGLALAAAALLTIAGCPTPTPGGNGTPAAIAGTWSGTLDCQQTQSAGGPTATTNSTLQIAITFDDNGIPTSVTILGYINAPDSSANVAQVSDSETITSTSGAEEITQVVTVTAATYSGSSAHIELRIDHTSTEGAVTQTGTGTQTIGAAVSGAALTYSADVDYQVTMSVAGIDIQTTETTTCTGTLAKQ